MLPVLIPSLLKNTLPYSTLSCSEQSLWWFLVFPVPFSSKLALPNNLLAKYQASPSLWYVHNDQITDQASDSHTYLFMFRSPMGSYRSSKTHPLSPYLLVHDQTTGGFIQIKFLTHHPHTYLFIIRPPVGSYRSRKTHPQLHSPGSSVL